MPDCLENAGGEVTLSHGRRPAVLESSRKSRPSSADASRGFKSSLREGQTGELGSGSALWVLPERGPGNTRARTDVSLPPGVCVRML